MSIRGVRPELFDKLETSWIYKACSSILNRLVEEQNIVPFGLSANCHREIFIKKAKSYGLWMYIHRIVSANQTNQITYTYQEDGIIQNVSTGYSERIMFSAEGCEIGVHLVTGLSQVYLD